MQLGDRDIEGNSAHLTSLEKPSHFEIYCQQNSQNTSKDAFVPLLKAPTFGPGHKLLSALIVAF